MTTLLAFPYPAVIKYFDFYKVTWFESSIHFPVELLCLRRNKIFPLAATQKLFFLKKAAGKRHINPIYAKGSFYTPWKNRKSLVFWCFQGVKKEQWYKMGLRLNGRCLHFFSPLPVLQISAVEHLVAWQYSQAIYQPRYINAKNRAQPMNGFKKPCSSL